MSRPVYPKFDRYPDEAAEAFSELIARPDDFVFRTGTGEIVPTFPPAETEVAGIVSAFREDDNQPTGDTSHLTFLEPVNGFTMPETARALIDGYSLLVKPYHDVIEARGEVDASLASSLAISVELMAAQQGLRTVGMYVLASAVGDETAHYAALGIPRQAYDQLADQESPDKLFRAVTATCLPKIEQVKASFGQIY